jgi:hypothetical protein
MEHFGGCSMLSGGGIMYVKDPARGFEHFKAMCCLSFQFLFDL